MAKLFRLADYRRTSLRVSFNRQELRQLLNVYSRRVVAGEWRDYAIDHQPGLAVFSIFRHSRDAPLFKVAKVAGRGDRADEYIVVKGVQKVVSGTSIGEVLSIFDRKAVELIR